ncbi:MAG TPA: hypothetical protein VGC67_01905 [Cellulomonas sp.]
MITDSLIRFVGQSIRAVLGLLPSWTPPADAFGTQATSIGTLAVRADGYFPVLVLGICLAFVLALKVLLLAWRVLLFLYHQVWGSD